ncbi:MAG: hypothetical protein QXO15_02130 [Nitrososphaerota archaeon]
MATPKLRVSKRILEEIDKQIKDEVVKEVAKNLLQFELENWRYEKLHYKDFYMNQLTIYCRKRLNKS